MENSKIIWMGVASDNTNRFRRIRKMRFGTHSDFFKSKIYDVFDVKFFFVGTRLRFFFCIDSTVCTEHLCEKRIIDRK